MEIMRNKQKTANPMLTHRVITLLNRQEMDFLDKLGKDALFSTGHKLSYNEILRTLIEFAMEIGVSGEKTPNPHELKQRIYEKMKRALENKAEKPLS